MGLAEHNGLELLSRFSEIEIFAILGTLNLMQIHHGNSYIKVLSVDLLPVREVAKEQSRSKLKVNARLIRDQ